MDTGTGRAANDKALNSRTCNTDAACAQGDDVSPDKEEAARFLALLDPDGTFTFQTFDDHSERKDRGMARVVHGTLDEHWSKLQRLNAKGAGIFVTVNATDGKGRKRANITRVRALFSDLDGAPLEPVMANWLTPHIVVETSPSRFRAYWRAADVRLEDFTDAQKALIARFKSDPSVHDLPRVMRLPGFVHCKGKPFLSRIIRVNEAPPYRAADLTHHKSNGGIAPNDYSVDDVNALPNYMQGLRTASKVIGEDSETWQTQLNTKALANLSAWVPEIFPGARRTSAGGYRITSKMLNRNLEEDLSIDPTGIVDFGIHDMGDKRQGKRTPVDIVVEYNDMNYEQAVDWLSEKLGVSLPDTTRDHDPHVQIVNEMLRCGYAPAAIVKVLLDQGKPREYAERQVAEAKKKITLVVDDKGIPYKSPTNIRIALIRMGITLRHDRFADRVLINGLADFGPTLEDAAVDRIWLLMEQRLRFRPSKELVRSVIEDAVRRDNQGGSGASNRMRGFHRACDGGRA